MNQNFFRDGSNGKIEILRSKLAEFLSLQGFKKFKMPKGNYQLFRVQRGRVLFDATFEDLHDVVKNHLLIRENRADVYEAFLRGDYLGKNNFYALEQLPNVRFDCDNPVTAHFFFRNGILKVTPEKREMISYEDFPCYIHESQIIQHDFEILDTEHWFSSDFDAFMKNISGKNKERYYHLTTAVGYLLHSYKDPAFARAVILVDENLNLSGEAMGGTGKSLVATAISKLTSTLNKDGKTISVRGNKFLNQDVSLFHNVVSIDDVLPNFDFDGFYSMITSEMVVEEKFKAPYRIPFALSPKFLVTSNYMVIGDQAVKLMKEEKSK